MGEGCARGPDGLEYRWGDEWRHGVANSGDQGDEVMAPVGSNAGNVSLFVACDLGGNVSELATVWYQPFPGSDVPNPNIGEKHR